MVDVRKGILLCALFTVCLSVFGQGFSLGALDMVTTSRSTDTSGAGALDLLIGSGKGTAQTLSYAALDVVTDAKAEVSDASALGALAAIASGTSGEYRSGPLNFISKSQSGKGYYSSGAWDTSNGFVGQIGSPWMGQMMAAPSWGRITSTFGFRPRFGRMHKGIDIAMTVGDTVNVPLPGIVDRVSYEAGGYGNYVVIKHDNGLETRYAHLSSVLVSPGETVAANCPIALSGNTGNSTGPHLHFETRVNGSAIDPQTVFDFAGGMMIPRTKLYGSAGYSVSTAVSALGQVSKNGTRGRSLQDKRTYVVRTGDTLQKIAARAGISVIQLCKLNFISETDQLTPGTMIRLSR